jgi:hypothetical protein
VIPASAGRRSASLGPGEPLGDEPGHQSPPRGSGVSPGPGSALAAPGAAKAIGAGIIVDLSVYMTLRILLGALLRQSRVHFVNADFVE